MSQKRHTDIHNAKTQLSRHIARLERVEPIVVTCGKQHSTPLDDPLLRVEEYSHDGPIKATANENIDSTVYRI